jgi:DNA repair protein RadC
LLAIIMRTGTPSANVLDLAHQLLMEFSGLEGVSRAAIPELCRIKGLGQAKAIEIKAALELGVRAIRSDPLQRPAIRSPEDVHALVGTRMSMLESEQLRVLLLNTKNRVIADQKVADGTVNQTTVRIGEIFRDAVRHQATGVILVHNHPSGDPTPSRDDVDLTRDARRAGKLLQIDVLDHIVIGRGAGRTYKSLRELGLAFEPELRAV